MLWALPILLLISSMQVFGAECSVFNESNPNNPTRINLWKAAEKDGHGQWSIVQDENGREWVSGFSHLGRGTSEFYIRTPEKLSQDEQFLLIIKYFQERGLSHIPDSKVGYTLHFD
jgi:hypothetical protein